MTIITLDNQAAPLGEAHPGEDPLGSSPSGSHHRNYRVSGTPSRNSHHNNRVSGTPSGNSHHNNRASGTPSGSSARQPASQASQQHEYHLPPASHAPEAELAVQADPFEQGYDAAAQELLANLVWMAEDFLSARRNPTVADRKLLYGFVEMLERRLSRMQSEAGVVEGGLGI